MVIKTKLIYIVKRLVGN